MVADVLVAVRDHRAAPIPPLAPNNVHLTRQKRICCAHDGADVHVVFEVLDGHMEVMTLRVQVGDDGVHGPIPVGVDDVSGVAFGEELRVVLLTFRPRAFPRSDTVAALVPFGGALQLGGAFRLGGVFHVGVVKRKLRQAQGPPGRGCGGTPRRRLQ